MSAMFIRISCSFANDIMSFCAAAPATSNTAFLKPRMWARWASNTSEGALPNSGMPVSSLTTAMAGVIRSISPFIAFFKIMSTVSIRLISLVPSKMRLMRASRKARSARVSAL